MERRSFLLGAMATCILTPNVSSATGGNYTYPNGRWYPGRGMFEWHSIGVDPFGKQPLRTALQLFNIPEQNQAIILQTIEVRPGVYTSPNQGVARIQSGHQYAAMVSGGISSPHAWAVPNVKPFPNSGWSSTSVDVWVVYVNGQRYMIGRPHACSNWLLMPGTNAPYHCPPPCCR